MSKKYRKVVNGTAKVVDADPKSEENFEDSSSSDGQPTMDVVDDRALREKWQAIPTWKKVLLGLGVALLGGGAVYGVHRARHRYDEDGDFEELPGFGYSTEPVDSGTEPEE